MAFAAAASIDRADARFLLVQIQIEQKEKKELDGILAQAKHKLQAFVEEAKTAANFEISSKFVGGSLYHLVFECWSWSCK
jgi:hypothetical protein